MIILGQYLDGKRSNIQSARLETINDTCFAIRSNDIGQECDRTFLFTDLNIESRLGNTPRQLLLPDNQVFSTLEHKQVDELQKQYTPSPFKALIHKLESHLILALAALAMTIAVIFGASQYGIPKAAEIIAKNIPHNSLGDHSINILDETLFEPSELDIKEQQRIQALVKPYLETYPDIHPKLSFRSGMPANALALPDGNIVFTDDFVKLTDKDGEILSVLFHEIGHIENKHVTRRAIQGTALTIFIFLITGDLEVFDFAATIPAALMDLSYSREFEREADRFSVQEMKKHKIAPIHFITIMEKLEHSHKAEPLGNEDKDDNKFTFPEFFSTHPLTEERIKIFKQ